MRTNTGKCVRRKFVAFVMDGGRCYLCRTPLRMSKLRPHEKALMPAGAGKGRGCPFATTDHVVPTIRGGTSALSNIRPACRKCNQDKGDWTYTELLLGFKLQEVT